ncbi:hypothetical protein PVAND_002747 [Polypedilum vanderplanki]|uniref:Uncharacterized protein n=1 Tax=Polypedilum vanderplanki TaxID=319348 RepID=A0A9J6BRX5_POLVA|nr:hypothetical protein PVAND_002747 [Polypedilum vanderplanki]
MSNQPLDVDMSLLKVPRIQKMGVSMTSLKSSDDESASGLGYQNTLCFILNFMQINFAHDHYHRSNSISRSFQLQLL